MTIRELQYAIQEAIDSAPRITDGAKVVVYDGSIYAVQTEADGENWHCLYKAEKEGWVKKVDRCVMKGLMLALCPIWGPFYLLGLLIEKIGVTIEIRKEG